MNRIFLNSTLLRSSKSIPNLRPTHHDPVSSIHSKAQWKSFLFFSNTSFLSRDLKPVRNFHMNHRHFTSDEDLAEAPLVASNKTISVRGSVNRAIICGYVGLIKTFQTKSGDAVRIAVATNETFKSKLGKKVDTTTWHQVTIFNQTLCENIQKNLKKGMLVYLEGVMNHYKSKDAESYHFQILCNVPSNFKIISGSIDTKPKTSKEDEEETNSEAEEE